LVSPSPTFVGGVGDAAYGRYTGQRWALKYAGSQHFPGTSIVQFGGSTGGAAPPFPTAYGSLRAVLEPGNGLAILQAAAWVDSVDPRRDPGPPADPGRKPPDDPAGGSA